MQHIKRYFGIGALILLLTACGNSESLKTDITISPYEMSEKESLLMSKADITSIAFFELSGVSAKEDLKMSVEVYEKGVFQEELLSTWGPLEEMHKDELISFAISGFDQEEAPLKLMLGIPSGLATSTYTNDYMKDVNGHSFSALIDEKITLQKNEPVYLAAWIGTTDGSLRSISGEIGQLPEGLEEADFALLYKVILTELEED